MPQQPAIGVLARLACRHGVRAALTRTWGKERVPAPPSSWPGKGSSEQERASAARDHRAAGPAAGASGDCHRDLFVESRNSETGRAFAWHAPSPNKLRKPIERRRLAKDQRRRPSTGVSFGLKIDSSGSRVSRFASRALWVAARADPVLLRLLPRRHFQTGCLERKLDKCYKPCGWAIPLWAMVDESNPRVDH